MFQILFWLWAFTKSIMLVYSLVYNILCILTSVIWLVWDRCVASLIWFKKILSQVMFIQILDYFVLFIKLVYTLLLIFMLYCFIQRYRCNLFFSKRLYQRSVFMNITRKRRCKTPYLFEMQGTNQSYFYKGHGNETPGCY